MRKNSNTGILMLKIIIFIIFVLATSAAYAAKKLGSTKVSGVLTLPAEYSKQIKTVLVAWSQHGMLYFLNSDLKTYHDLKIDINRITEVVLGDKKLLVSGILTTRAGRTHNKIVEIDLMGSRIAQSWSSTDIKFRSVAYNDKQAMAISYKGELYELKADNQFKKRKSYPKNSFYLVKGDSTPIICTAPDIMSKANKPGSCRRDGKPGWMQEGQWASNMKPYICGKYLIEPNKARGSNVKSKIVVRDIQNGAIVGQQELPLLSISACAGDKLLYAARKVVIAELPGLKTLSEVKCGSSKVKGLALYEDSLICVNRSLRVKKWQAVK